MSQIPESSAFPDWARAEEALRLQNARLAALHEVVLDLTSTLELGDVLQRVAVMAQTLSASAHTHIFLYDAERDELNLVASHWGSEQRMLPLQPRRTGVTYSVARTGKPEFIEDSTRHPAYAAEPAGMQPGALACLPLVTADHVLGTLNLGYWRPYQFDAETRSFLDLVARHAAIAIETARLYEVAIEKARIEHELQVARELQSSLIPREVPQIIGWDFAALWRPAHIVSGDFYDFVAVDHVPLQGVIIADVSDKGMPAALFMAVARSTIRASITSACCPADCIVHANRLLCTDTANGMFVTLCYVQLDPRTGEVVYVNAGHNPPLWYRANQDQVIELTNTGMALGIYDTYRFDQRTMTLDAGDFIFLYTDGVIDAGNARREEFGKERLLRIIRDQRRVPAAEMVAALQRALAEFVGETPQFDDITVVVIKRL